MLRISRLKAFVSIFALLPVLSVAVPPGQAAPPAKAAKFPKGTGDAASCRAMTGRAIGPDMRIATAEYDENGAMVGNTQVDVPLCRIVGVAYPTADSRIGFEVWMPPVSAWNGKFQAEGSGGSAGAISPGPMLTALKAGYATMSTDNGHVTNPDAPNGGSEQTWALGPSGKDDRFRLSRAACLHGGGENYRGGFLRQESQRILFHRLLAGRSSRPDGGYPLPGRL